MLSFCNRARGSPTDRLYVSWMISLVCMYVCMCVCSVHFVCVHMCIWCVCVCVCIPFTVEGKSVFLWLSCVFQLMVCERLFSFLKSVHPTCSTISYATSSHSTISCLKFMTFGSLCVCVCVRERERERERDGGGGGRGIVCAVYP